MTEILLIRHGETSWNAERRLQGHIDIPLNDAGRMQAEALGRALATERFDLIVSSDLQRANATAHAVARHHIMDVLVDPRLRERGYGAFEGLLYAEIEDRYPADFASWQARDVDAVMPDGGRVAESFRMFFQRSLNAIMDWAARHPGKRIVLVAHGGVLECAYRAALQMELATPRSFPIRNASINRFSVDQGRLQLASWGDIAHLADLARDELP